MANTNKEKKSKSTAAAGATGGSQATNQAASPPKQGLVKKMSPSAKHPKKDSKEAGTGTAIVPTPEGKQIFVLKLLSGDMLQLITKGDNAPYIKPATDYMKEHPEFTKEVLGIHAHEFYRRHKDNPMALKS